MRLFLRLSRIIDATNTRLGRAVAWLIVAAIVIAAVNAITRKTFNLSSNTWLEAQWLLFGAVFLLCAPWTLILNQHIRIDVVSTRLPKHLRDGIDVLGHTLFLIPFALLMIVTSIPFAWRSYSIDEQSFGAGGLPQWPAKMLVPLAFCLLLAQGISELIKRIAIMTGHMSDPDLNAPQADSGERV